MGSPWADVRRDFPALARHTYLNAAAASPTPRPVRAAVDAHYRQLEEDGDLHWEHWLARVEDVRAAVARFIGAHADEVAFVPNTSTGINLIADLLAEAGPVVSDDLEFPTVTLPWVHRGADMRLVAAVSGVVPPEAFAEAVQSGAATIAVSHVQFSNGCRQDLDAFGRVKGGRHLVVCASQSAGAFPIDVGRSGIDALASAGHKWMCAGYGAGFAYISRALLARHPPRAIGWLSVRDPFRFERLRYEVLPSNRRAEMGCPPFAQILALGAAVDYLAGVGIEAISQRVLALNAYLTDTLRRHGVDVLSPGGLHRSGETLCAVPDPPAGRAFLESRGVLVTEKPEGLRLATHFYNNEADIDRGVRVLAEYLAGVQAQTRADGWGATPTV